MGLTGAFAKLKRRALALQHVNSVRQHENSPELIAVTITA